MSSIAAAKKRRAGIQSNVPSEPIQKTPQPPAQPLSMVQVINSIDKRLINLETFVNIYNSTKPNLELLPNSTSDNKLTSADTNVFSEYVDDMNLKFSLLAEEITNLKDTVLKLQTYTMDVNKTLLEERINILSDYSDVKSSIFKTEISNETIDYGVNKELEGST
jgi:hypothetical protein